MLKHFPWPMPALSTVSSVPAHQQEHQHSSAGCASQVCLYQRTVTLTGAVQRLRHALDPEALAVLPKETRHTTNGSYMPLLYTGKEEDSE